MSLRPFIAFPETRFVHYKGHVYKIEFRLVGYMMQSLCQAVVLVLLYFFFNKTDPYNAYILCDRFLLLLYCYALCMPHAHKHTRSSSLCVCLSLCSSFFCLYLRRTCTSPKTFLSALRALQGPCVQDRVWPPIKYTMRLQCVERLCS